MKTTRNSESKGGQAAASAAVAQEPEQPKRPLSEIVNEYTARNTQDTFIRYEIDEFALMAIWNAFGALQGIESDGEATQQIKDRVSGLRDWLRITGQRIKELNPDGVKWLESDMHLKPWEFYRRTPPCRRAPGTTLERQFHSSGQKPNEWLFRIEQGVNASYARQMASWLMSGVGEIVQSTSAANAESDAASVLNFVLEVASNLLNALPIENTKRKGGA